MPQPLDELHRQRAFSVLPLELFLIILDELLGTRNGRRPVAYSPSNEGAKALRALTQVSRSVYPLASKYLYSYCLYIDNCTSYARFRRTLGLHMGNHPQALQYGQAGRSIDLFSAVNPLQYVTSIFISPTRSEQDGKETPMIRLPQVIDLFNTIGPTLKKLVLDLLPMYTPRSEMYSINPHVRENNIFLYMPNLEELVISDDVAAYFPHPPPNLKRLGVTTQEVKDALLDFCFAISSLEILVFLRPPGLLSTDIDVLFERYKGKSLDVVLVDVNSNHRTPTGTRSWKGHDAVRIWEADVPTSFYGDDDNLTLCDSWIWTRGVEGTLWTQENRRMASWEEIEKRLAGPVHQILDVSNV